MQFELHFLPLVTTSILMHQDFFQASKTSDGKLASVISTSDSSHSLCGSLLDALFPQERRLRICVAIPPIPHPCQEAERHGNFSWLDSRSLPSENDAKGEDSKVQ
jgi:hypothetical protein